MKFVVEPGGALAGRVRLPGDKSISHRAIMLGAIAAGETRISGFLEGEDALATLNIFRALGVHIVGPADGPADGPERGEVRVHGVGLRGLKAAGRMLDCGNSGTSMRLIAGLLAGQAFDSELTGDESLRRRPMMRIVEPLARMGARIETAEGGRPPLKIRGNPRLKAIDYAMPVASAQVKSALLLAGLYAEGETRVTEPAATRDHTERMLAAFGHPLRRDGNSVSVSPGPLKGAAISIPADISSAAFLMVGASIAPGSDITLTGVGINPTRTGAIDILKLMGADIELRNERIAGGEPVADLRVRHAKLKGIVIPERLVALAIDEFPALFVAAANAEGETTLSGAAELRVKESDRIQAMADGFAALGVAATTTPDGIRICGGRSGGGNMGGGKIASRGDHRIAMAFAVAALRAAGPIEIEDCANVATSFPGFVDLARSAGLRISIA